MMALDKDQIGGIRAEIGRGADLGPVIAALKKAIELKSAHQWRAEAGSCCFGPEIARCIDAELQILENTLQCFEAGDRAGGLALLEEYERLIG